MVEQKARTATGLETVNLSDISLVVREQGEAALRSLEYLGFLLVAYTPPVTEHADERNTAETRLGGHSVPGSRPTSFTLAVPVVKSKSGRPGQQISVGRADDNDIVIRAFGISKQHAAFVPAEDGSILLVDVGSANGTSVNSIALEKDKPVRLHNGDVITFWWYVFEFTYLDTFLRTMTNDAW